MGYPHSGGEVAQPRAGWAHSNREGNVDAEQRPIAGRLQRPGWKDPRLLIGLVLIAVSVMATASIVSGADRTDPQYVARDSLTPGTVITEDHLAVLHVRVGAGEYVMLGEPIVGMVITRVVGAGELIPSSALASPDSFAARPIAVTTARPLAQGIERGAIVDVWLTSAGSGEVESVLIAGELVVDQVERRAGAFSSGAVETVYLMVPKRDVGDFLAALASEGEVTVVGIAGSATS